MVLKWRKSWAYPNDVVELYLRNLSCNEPCPNWEYTPSFFLTICKLDDEPEVVGPWKLLQNVSFKGELRGENLFVSKTCVPSERNSVDEDDSFWDNEPPRLQVSGDVGLLLLLLLLLYATEEAVVEADLEGEAIIRRKQWVFFKAVVAVAILNYQMLILHRTKSILHSRLRPMSRISFSWYGNHITVIDYDTTKGDRLEGIFCAFNFSCGRGEALGLCFCNILKKFLANLYS